MFNTAIFDSKITASLNKTISTLTSTKFKKKEDKEFVDNLNSLVTKEQLELVYNIISGGYSSIQNFIDRKETVSVPGLGMFRYVEGKKIAEDTKNETLKAHGYDSFKDIISSNLKEDIKSEMRTVTHAKLNTEFKNKISSGNRNVVLPFTLSYLK